jgi:hypothetical protein
MKGSSSKIRGLAPHVYKEIRGSPDIARSEVLHHTYPSFAPSSLLSFFLVGLSWLCLVSRWPLCKIVVGGGRMGSRQRGILTRSLQSLSQATARTIPRYCRPELQGLRVNTNPKDSYQEDDFLLEKTCWFETCLFTIYFFTLMCGPAAGLFY